MAERRYSEEEIAAIFRAAAEQPQPDEVESTPAGGLTLAQLQSIGREVGLEPEAIARAARAVELQPVRARTFLGLPLAVTHTVQLQRRLGDDEWDRLVVQLRDVFGARGRVRIDGSLKQWNNGNLHVLLEPTDQGDRLRFGTVHGGARAGIAAGLILVGTAVVAGIVTAANGVFADTAAGLGFMVTVGVAMIANRAFRLPAWARTRTQQMAALGQRLALPASSTGSPDAHS